MKLWKTFNVQKREDISYYNTSEGFETEGFAMHLDRLIREEMAARERTESCSCVSAQTGLPETAGPSGGHMLRSRRLKGAAVIGTLDKPVHAMNLDLYARYIRLHYPDYVVVAIDASVGSLDHVGYATLGRGALQPGLGVSKELQAVGDIAITGIVGGVGSGIRSCSRACACPW